MLFKKLHFFKASSAHRKNHLCQHWPTEITGRNLASKEFVAKTLWPEQLLWKCPARWCQRRERKWPHAFLCGRTEAGRATNDPLQHSLPETIKARAASAEVICAVHPYHCCFTQRQAKSCKSGKYKNTAGYQLSGTFYWSGWSFFETQVENHGTLSWKKTACFFMSLQSPVPIKKINRKLSRSVTCLRFLGSPGTGMLPEAAAPGHSWAGTVTAPRCSLRVLRVQSAAVCCWGWSEHTKRKANYINARLYNKTKSFEKEKAGVQISWASNTICLPK